MPMILLHALGLILFLSIPQDLFACNQAMIHANNLRARWLESDMNFLFVTFVVTFLIAGFLGVSFRLSKDWQERGRTCSFKHRCFYCSTGILLAGLAFILSGFLWSSFVELDLIDLLIVGLFYIQGDTLGLAPLLFLALLVLVTLLSLQLSKEVRKQNKNAWLQAFYLDGVKGLYFFGAFMSLDLVRIMM